MLMAISSRIAFCSLMETCCFCMLPCLKGLTLLIAKALQLPSLFLVQIPLCCCSPITPRQLKLKKLSRTCLKSSGTIDYLATDCRAHRTSTRISLTKVLDSTDASSLFTGAEYVSPTLKGSILSYVSKSEFALYYHIKAGRLSCNVPPYITNKKLTY